MRSASEVVDEVTDLWDRGGATSETGAVIEQDRIEAQLAALRELDELADTLMKGNSAAMAWAMAHDQLCASLESARAELKKGGGG